MWFYNEPVENPKALTEWLLSQQSMDKKIILIGQKAPHLQVEDMISRLGPETVIVAFGNMGAGGAALIKHFEHTSN